MFGWFKTTCPVDSADQEWIERRMAWLVREFGEDRILRAEVILPTDHYFPDAYGGTEADVRAMFDRLCGYMQVDPTRIELGFYTEKRPRAGNLDVAGFEQGTAGLYDEREGKTVIWVEASALEDSMSVAGTLVHELCHVHLLGDRRVVSDTPDHEALTDLLSVFLGVGLFPANSTVRDSSWRSGGWEGWRIGRQGYLTSRMFGYAFAMFAWRRGESNPNWAGHLRADVRSTLRDGLKFLNKVGPSTFAWNGEPISAPPGAFTPNREPELTPLDEPASEDEGASDNSPQDGEMARERDSHVTRGIVHTNNGDYEAAIAEFDQAIRLDADDGEAHLLRSVVHFRLGQYAKACADGNEAVRLDPDDTESHRVRGAAALAAADPDLALEDFEFILATGAMDADAYFHMGLALAAKAEFERAVAAYSKAIRYEPTRGEVYLWRGVALERLGRLAESAADREEAVRRDPNLATEEAD
jgi:tetratricopeptide (TPR) repeat protein